MNFLPMSGLQRQNFCSPGRRKVSRISAIPSVFATGVIFTPAFRKRKASPPANTAGSMQSCDLLIYRHQRRAPQDASIQNTVFQPEDGILLSFTCQCFFLFLDPLLDFYHLLTVQMAEPHCCQRADPADHRQSVSKCDRKPEHP